MVKAKGYHCSNCRESIGGEGLNRVSIGQNRFVVFCGKCNCFISLEDPTLIAKVTTKPVAAAKPVAVVKTTAPVENPESK